MTHTCNICSATSETVEFYKGVSSRCKECHKAAIRRNRAENAEYYREYDKMRFQRDAHRQEANKAYARTERGKEVSARARGKWLSQNPEKRAAHIILGNAVRDGRISKPEICEQCGDKPTSRRLHAHHHDYALPLVVQWICAKCHGEEHHGEAPEPPKANKVRGRHVRREQ